MSKKRKTITLMATARNPVAQNPLLKKGGAHQKSNKALRAEQKKALRNQMRNADPFSNVLFGAFPLSSTG